MMDLRRAKIYLCNTLRNVTIKQACIIFIVMVSVYFTYHTLNTTATKATHGKKKLKDSNLAKHKPSQFISSLKALHQQRDEEKLLSSDGDEIANQWEGKVADNNLDVPGISLELFKAQKADKQGIQWWHRAFHDNIESVEKNNIFLLVIVSSAPKRYEQRKAIRNSWWKRCKEITKVHCIFFTDGSIEDYDTRQDLKFENKNNDKDMNVHPYKSEFNFGQRYLYHLRWSLQQYDFDYILRLDDDQFICMDHLISNLQHYPKEHFIWSNIYCEKDKIRPDGRFIMLSKDLVETFTEYDNSDMLCHPYIDQQVGIWVEQLHLQDVYHHERRLYYKGPVQAVVSNPILVEGICSQFISIHGATPKQMTDLWLEKGNLTHYPKEIPLSLNEHCEYEQRFNWKVMNEVLKYEPKNCSSDKLWKPNGSVMGDDLLIVEQTHQEPLQKPSDMSWEELQPHLTRQLQEQSHRVKWWPHNATNISQTKKEYQLVLIVSSAPQRYDRRRAIRKTWWDDCKESKQIKCIFMTDGDISDKIIRNTLLEEYKTYQDIFVQPLTGGTQFGQRLLYQLRWVSYTYRYMYFMKIDDDQFLCLKRLLSDIRDAPRQQIIWSHVHCEDNLVRPDEGFLIISQDLVRIFLAQDEKQIKCHPYADQQIGIWVNELGLEDIYYHDRRIHHDPPASSMSHEFLKHEICSLYIALHGAYPKDMHTFWNAKGKYQKFSSIHILAYNEYCYYKQVMDWSKFSEEWRHEPQLCWTNPSWNITTSKDMYEGRESRRSKDITF